jgi:hypothetical protein
VVVRLLNDTFFCSPTAFFRTPSFVVFLAIKKEEKTSGLKMDDFLKDFCSNNCSFASRQINRSLSDWKMHWESDVHKIKYEDAYPEPRQDFRVDDLMI